MLQNCYKIVSPILDYGYKVFIFFEIDVTNIEAADFVGEAQLIERNLK